MLIFWKGKQMLENRDETENRYNHGDNCGCECCHCKKIFMLLVVLILVFIAGIMVGNCGRCRYADNYDYNQHYIQLNRMHHQKIKPKKFHRGMQDISSQNANQNGYYAPAGNSVQPAPQPDNYPYQGSAAGQPYPAGQIGGFIIEVDQGN